MSNLVVAESSLVVNVRGVDPRHPSIRLVDNTKFLLACLGDVKLHHRSRSDISYVSTRKNEALLKDDGFDPNSRLFMTVHDAFDQHVAIALAPEVVWYAIAHEIGLYVKQNPELAAHLFGADANEKKFIEVVDNSLVYGGQQNNWGRSIGLVKRPLREVFTPQTLDVFVPAFTTLTEEVESVLLVSLMETLSPYAELQWSTMCGIPKIKLEGTSQDWELLLTHAKKAAAIFTDLKDYFDDLLPVLQELSDAANGGYLDEKFWKSIYKVSDMSGGPYVTGWLTTLLAYVNSAEGPEFRGKFDWRKQADSAWGGLKTHRYPAHVSKADFTWDYYGKKIPMTFAGGVIGVGYDGEFLAPRLGFAVCERPGF